MRSAVVYFSLLLQSLLAVPALCTSYHIYSVEPKTCIVSTGKERPGDNVRTVPYNNGCPPDTVVHTNAPITRQVSHGPVSGAVGLYIGIGGSPSNGTKLVWDRTPYVWQFNPSTSPDFHVVSVPGTELFWLDDPSNPKSVELAQAPIQKGDLFWSFDKAY